MRVANTTREARETTFNAVDLAKTELKSAMSSKDFTDGAAQAIKAMSAKSGYSIADMISVARPILNQLAADKGIQLSHADLDDLENSLSAIDQESTDAKVVNLKDKKKSKSPGSPTAENPKQGKLTATTSSEEEIIEPKRLPIGRAGITRIQEDLKQLINENLDNLLPQEQTALLTKAAPNQWAEKSFLTAAGSFGSFLKSLGN